MIKLSGLFNGTKLAEAVKDGLINKKSKAIKKPKVGTLKTDLYAYKKDDVCFQVINGEQCHFIRYYLDDEKNWSKWKVVTLSEEMICHS